MVNHISLVNTTFMTLDNQRLVVPNNQIWGSVIRNVAFASETRSMTSWDRSICQMVLLLCRNILFLR